MTYRTVKMSQVRPNPNQPRDYFNEDAIKELAASIKQYGQIAPIEVAPDNEKGGYEIVSGERRYRALTLLEKTTVKVSIISEQDELKRFKRSMSENVNREDMTPFEEAHGYQRILDEEDGATVASVAADFGKTTAYVKLRLALLDLRIEFQKLVQDGAIGTAAAVQIASLSLANQGALLGKFARGEFKADNEIVHFAFAMKQQQDQAVLMVVEDMSEQQREERAATQKKTRGTLDRVEQIRAMLDEIAKTDPVKLAQALEGQVGSRLEQLDRVADSLTKARWQLKQAKAHAEAAELIVNPEAEAEEHKGEPVAA
ncbi:MULTISPECIES: ParB/RepB/Spo0J family partition protein [unclassified Streptomyces]|uniref:ParB/RepB/Spo0J family partition protein n=1 Tax=unclassified Streptomyces TaxID=2593676 RepID=UPI00226F6559|nr:MULTISPECIES: ParB/RepB/Spo0J family partition protein [unclassified Streptomyces]MCY0938352.1 ParB/RepB/Spo0J family partition protein [Streptomyces sp. H34-S4]MDJ0383249.1 ParB/RepB/Spo0J family partition protein [Streptomyces sp. G-G2]